MPRWAGRAARDRAPPPTSRSTARWPLDAMPSGGGTARTRARACSPRPPTSLVDRHGTDADEVAALGAELRAAAPARAGLPAPRGRDRLGGTVRARAHRSTTCSRGGRGWSTSCPIAAPSIAPRVADILGDELGWDAGRRATEVATFLASAPPRVRRSGAGRRRRGRARPRGRPDGRRGHRTRLMADDRLVLALDQGTTSSRRSRSTVTAAAVVERATGVPAGLPVARPRDPRPRGHLGRASSRVAREVVVGRRGAGADRGDRASPTSARPPCVWERATGRPVAPAIVWQSRITAPFCERAPGRRRRAADPRPRPGCPIDAYFSGPKIRHILRDGDLRPRPRAASSRSGPWTRSSCGA